jgi:hypothetical protein
MQRKGVLQAGEEERCSCGLEGISGKEARRRRSMQAEMQTTVLGSRRSESENGGEGEREGAEGRV